MALVTIGGEAIAVALPNFKTLKAAWPYIAALQDAGPMDGIDAVLGLVAVGAVDQTLTVDDLEQRLTPAELPGLRPFVNALMIEAGLAGEPAPSLEGASPLTATSTPSSPSSSPPDAATGM